MNPAVVVPAPKSYPGRTHTFNDIDSHRFDISQSNSCEKTLLNFSATTFSKELMPIVFIMPGTDGPYSLLIGIFHIPVPLYRPDFIILAGSFFVFQIAIAPCGVFAMKPPLTTFRPDVEIILTVTPLPVFFEIGR